MKTMRDATTTPLLPVAVSMMGGIAAACSWHITFPFVFVLPVSVVAAFLCRRSPQAQSAAVCCCCAVLGVALWQMQCRGGGRLAGALDAVVVSEPAEKPRTVAVDLLAPSAGGRPVRCLLAKDSAAMTLKPGDGIVATLYDRGGGMCYAGGWRRGGGAMGRLSLWQRSRVWFLRQRHALLQRYRGFNASADVYAVLAAMTLGDKSAQTRDLKETYTVSGAAHVMAISGLHVGVVYMLLTWLVPVRRRLWLTQTLTVAAIWAFALLTGLSPSVTRAATMVTIYSLATLRGGRQPPVNVLCLAAVIMLAADAGLLFDVGFQLAFASVFAIVTLMPLLQHFVHPRNPLLRLVCGTLLLTVCAQVGTAPLIAYHFGRIATYSLLTNIVVVPAATVVIYCALAALLVPSASVVLLWTVEAMNGWLRAVAALPGAAIEGLAPSAAQVAMAYMLIAAGAFLLNIIKNYTSVGKKQYLCPKL